VLPGLDRLDSLDDQLRGGKAVPDDAHRLLPSIGAQARLNAFPHQIGAEEPGNVLWIAAAHGAGGGPVRAGVPARRSASGSRYRPAIRRTRAAASAR